MVKKVKRVTKKRYIDEFQDVFLELSSKNLNPDKITKTLNIQPDVSYQKGLMKNVYGRILKLKNGKPAKSPVGSWILNSHAGENSTLEKKIEDILKQIRPKKAVLRRILKKVKGILKIVIEPHKDVASASYLFSGEILNEFTCLGIDIEFTIDIPQKWSEIRRKIITKQIRNNFI
jgi:hypothetical protein